MLSPARIVGIALCGAAGYLGASMRAPTTAPARSPQPPISIDHQAPPRPPLEVTISSSRESALMAEWEGLRALHGGTAAEFPALYNAIKDVKDAFRRRAYRSALIAEWAMEAPQAALAFLQEKDRGMTGQLLREWLRVDAQSAINAMLAGGEKLRGDLRGLLSDIARAAPARLTEVVSSLPKPDSRWDATTLNAFELFAQKDPETARAAALAVRGAMRGQALGGVAMAWAQTDASAALAWAKALPAGEERDAVLKSLLTGWARRDPMAALDHIDLVPPGGDDMAHASDVGAQVLREAAKRDWNTTMQWLREHPGKLGRTSLDGLQSTLSEKLNADPAGTLRSMAQSGVQGIEMVFANAILNEGYAQRDAIWRWLDDEPASNFTRQARSSLINAIAWKEPDVALTFLEKLPDSEENRQLLEQGTRSLINGGSQMNRFEELLANASPKMRPYLLQTGFEHGLQNGAPNPALWTARLDELPPERRLNAMGALARGWATGDPEGAIAWATSLPDAAQRDHAFESAARTWAATDSYAAAQWINSLPSGSNRDVAVAGLVGALARNQPENAWTWALSIETPQRRLQALQLAYALTRDRDPSVAENLLQSANLSPEEMKALQGAGSRRSRR